MNIALKNILTRAPSKRSHYWACLFSIFICTTYYQAANAATHWLTVGPRLEYTQLNANPLFPWSHIHVFRFSLNDYQLALQPAEGMDNARAAHVSLLTQQAKALIGVNGGFFSPDFQPLGLRIQNGKIKSPLKTISWWGVFYTQNKHPSVVSAQKFAHSNNINFAVQGGPRLIIDGNIPKKLKAGFAERTALGIDKQNRILVLSTEKSPMSTEELAQLMRAPETQNGIGCLNALNLDGGSSSQLFAKLKNFSLDIQGLAAVADAVVVIPNPAKAE